MQNQYLQCRHKKLGTFLARTGFGAALFVKRALNCLTFPSLLVTFRTSLLLTPAYPSISCSCLDFAMTTKFVLYKGFCHKIFDFSFFYFLLAFVQKIPFVIYPNFGFQSPKFNDSAFCSRVRQETETLKSPVTSFLITSYSSSFMGCIYQPLLLLMIIVKIKKYLWKFIAWFLILNSLTFLLTVTNFFNFPESIFACEVYRWSYLKEQKRDKHDQLLNELIISK